MIIIKLILILMIVLSTNITTVSAQQIDETRYYAGNYQTQAYGGKVYIHTPLNPFLLASSGLSNWISTPPPYWIQAGW